MTSPTDYCTRWPEGSWAHCCALHDLAYADLTAAKLGADWELVRCVADAAGWPMALTMGAGVLLLGLPFWIRARRWR
ncbi:hypothetical protein [Aureimonas ureilytica]|uniref:hypothetical protein n=1 Tax=Aureimonas ureilytica TaxID=401562 RepID=UPI000371602A|nr:hypothetical protein [Aureimonas ureilytica]